MKISEYAGIIKGTTLNLLQELKFFSDGGIVHDARIVTGRGDPADLSTCFLDIRRHELLSDYVWAHFDSDGNANFNGDVTTPASVSSGSIVSGAALTFTSTQGLQDQNGTTVVGNQVPGIADSSNDDDNSRAINEILIALRSHGLIES